MMIVLTCIIFMLAAIFLFLSLYQFIGNCGHNAQNETIFSTPPGAELLALRATMSQRRRAQPPSQVQPPSAPSEGELQDERERLVLECLFSRKLEEGDSVAVIQSIIADVQDWSPTVSSSTSTKPPATKLDECSICLDSYKTGETICWSKIDECDHIFHSECIQEWMINNANDKCPLCRANLMLFHSEV